MRVDWRFLLKKGGDFGIVRGMEWIEITWTSGNIDEARRICRYLVQERMVVSAKIIPWVETIVMLDNQLETVQESQCVLRAKEGDFEQIAEVIRDNHSYQIPEVTWNRIEGGNREYIQWLEETKGRA